jgi:hypothetical protein
MVELYPATGHDYEYLWSYLELYHLPINPDRN